MTLSDILAVTLAIIAGLIFVGGFVWMIATEIYNEFKARTDLEDSNEKKREKMLRKSIEIMSKRHP
ncbi:MAG TPA: hypothetical protein VL981_02390 [Candidatus Methylacidiphilales bacterium]|nr:hypothetical protein [Candidatus Methylacidiphilales bacterium]